MTLLVTRHMPKMLFQLLVVFLSSTTLTKMIKKLISVAQKAMVTDNTKVPTITHRRFKGLTHLMSIMNENIDKDIRVALYDRASAADFYK